MAQENNSLDVVKTNSLLFCQLGKELGCKRINMLQTCANPKSNNFIKLSDFRKRFMQQQDTVQMDADEQSLQELRFMLFLHLYRLLVKLESDKTMRQNYLVFCYYLVSADMTHKMELEESLKYREKYSDRLMKMAENIIQLNKLTFDNTVETIVEMGSAHSKHMGCLSRCIETDKRTERDIIKTQYVQEAEVKVIHKVSKKPEDKVVLDKTLSMKHTINNAMLGSASKSLINGAKKDRKLAQESFCEDASKDGNIAKEETINIELTRESAEAELAENYIIPRSSSKTDATKIGDCVTRPSDSENLQSASNITFRRSRQTDINLVSKFTHQTQSVAQKDRCEIIKPKELQQVKYKYLTTDFDQLISNINNAFESHNTIMPNVQQKLSLSRKKLMPHPRELQIVKMELEKDQQKCLRLSPTINRPKWQHQRHIIAASRFIIRLFQCNPAYQCSPMDPNAPNFIEQVVQFFEVMGNSCPNSIIDVAAVKQRLGAIVGRLNRELFNDVDLCLAEIAKIQLKQLLTTAEQMDYEKQLWKLRDYGNTVYFAQENRLQDALHALLGFECQQLRYSAVDQSLMLRYPNYQINISESYLLLSLGQVGYYYKQLQSQLLRLKQLGEVGEELSKCLLVELQLYSNFYNQQKAKPNQSLIYIFWQTRKFFHRFCWLLHMCRGFNSRQPLLKYLQQQLNVGNKEYNELLEQWLLAATRKLLARISSWLVGGELSEEKFFIVKHNGSKPKHYWQSHFELDEPQLPPFLNKQLAQKMLNIGKCHDYAKRFLGLQLKDTVPAESLQQQLSQACTQYYQQLEHQPLQRLLSKLEQQTSYDLFNTFNEWFPTPLELFTQLHQYLLLTDVGFVGQLIELLEPALEQPAEYYDTYLLNNMLEHLRDENNEQLCVAESSFSHTKASRCWQRFLLVWQLAPHWLPLLGTSSTKYESCFMSIWQMHYVNYVLKERIHRQQLHFHDRINLAASKDARIVKDLLKPFIKRLLKFMHNLRCYVSGDVLESALKDLSLDCYAARNLDDLLDKHGSYLYSIEWGLLQHNKSQHYLIKVYDIIMQLDAVQQKFFALCQLFNQSSNNIERRQDFRWSCQNTCDSICDLEKQFQWNLANFLISLFCTKDPKLMTLANRLDHNGYYKNMLRYQCKPNADRPLGTKS